MSTKERLLREAEKLMRTRGFAAFSYADLSESIGISKASIHHHFATKELLTSALIDEYLKKFQKSLERILTEEGRAARRLERYADFFIQSMIDDLLPLCGALSAEMSALPKPIQKRVTRFFELHLLWLQGVVRDGVTAGEIRKGVEVKRAAMLILSTLEGASLVAWAIKDGSLIKATIQQVVESLEA